MAIPQGPLPLAAGGRVWQQVRSFAAPAPPQRLRWDALQVTLTVVVAMQVWRVQELFPVIAFYGLPIAATLAAMLVFWLDRDPRRRLTNLDSHVVGAALGILLLAWLSVPGSLYPGFSAEFLLKDYCRTVVLMLLVAASVRGLADVRRLAWVQIAGVTLFSTVIMARSEIGSDGRLHAVAYYDANDLATLIVCTLPLVLYLWRRNTGLAARLLLAAVTVLLMVTLGRTGSRGGFLGFLAVAAYLLLRLRAVSTAKRAGAVALLAILLVAVAKDTYFERMETLLHPSTDYNWSGQSETGRVELWKRGIGYMLGHPVLGVGVGAFPMAEGTISPEAQQRYGRGVKWLAPHNAFIQIGAELGVLGLILFLALLRGAFRVLSRVQRGAGDEARFVAQALTASLVGFSVTAIFLSQAYWAYFYTLLGMSLGVARAAFAEQVLRHRAPLSSGMARYER